MPISVWPDRPVKENIMFWIGIAVAVGLIFLLTWIGAAMTRRGLPNNWERRDGAIVPGMHDEDFHH